ncbi:MULTISPECIES: cytochrome c [unclassified Nitrosomonas]|uniref:c-type cytochrome n=1 Tax=unclassified Nitrosomonas TaxID=2609265 RepID=UPI00089CFCFA|nr:MULTISPECIES: cytochrome c [unclassified Nitrosomonas]MDV6344055.1 cytochrome c [Nitrosomonas sp. Is37]SDZ01208.1 Cytochrome C oxidase, cbb3-type, subunit III [Nitrosomonas sp. Nm33]
MKETRLGSVVVVFCLMFVIIFIAINSAWSAQEEKSSTGFAWNDGAEIYAKICAYCHEADVGPQIRNRELPATYIRTIVRNGNRAMPAFRSSEIDDESLAKLVDFISQKESQH